MAYRIADKNIDEVLQHLDHREVMGYEKVPILLHPIPNHPLNQVPDNDKHEYEKPFQVTMYYGSSQNEHFLGPASLSSLAQQIWESEGPSGRNKDYLFNLVQAMRAIQEGLPSSQITAADPVKSSSMNHDIIDAHLAEVEAAVMKLEENFQKQGHLQNSS